jgi:hypothetical protein
MVYKEISSWPHNSLGKLKIMEGQKRAERNMAENGKTKCSEATCGLTRCDMARVLLWFHYSEVVWQI